MATESVPPPSYTESTHAAPDLNAPGIRAFLSERGWPVGFQDAIVKAMAKCPLRIYIIDDSGSMAKMDGQQMTVGSAGGAPRMVACSRWAEVTASCKFHVDLAAVANTDTEFRLLNSLPPIRVGRAGTFQGVQRLKEAFANAPASGTPLCRHIREVIKTIEPMADGLRLHGHKVVLVICTDGEASDGDLAKEMKPMEQLPVWVVVRLCTSDDAIVRYWNNIDSQLELEMDVLDDFASEATEVQSVNGWLTYGEPLHKLREFGLPMKELDMLDEALLDRTQMRTLVAMCMGVPRESLPEEWPLFLERVTAGVGQLPEVWSPSSKKTKPWILVKELDYSYNPVSRPLLRLDGISPLATGALVCVGLIFFYFYGLMGLVVASIALWLALKR